MQVDNTVVYGGAIVTPWVLVPGDEDLNLETHGCGCGCDDACSDCEDAGCYCGDNDSSDASDSSDSDGNNEPDDASSSDDSADENHLDQEDQDYNDTEAPVDPDPTEENHLDQEDQDFIPDDPASADPNHLDQEDQDFFPDTQSAREVFEDAGFDFKTGTGAPEVTDLSDEIKVAAPVIADWAERNGVNLVITSGTEGNHGLVSWHYSGDAIDLRGWGISPTRGEALAAELQTDLRGLGLDGGTFDAIFETYENNAPNNHFHIEFDRTINDRRAPSRDDPSILLDSRQNR